MIGGVLVWCRVVGVFTVVGSMEVEVMVGLLMLHLSRWHEHGGN